MVVGSALSEEYPEARELWGGRLVYTVYLHVGTGKNWILQYSLPHSADAASSGTSVRPEPPWPYELARPAPREDDLDSDTLMIHGFVTLEGRLEKMAVVFPSGFANAKLVLDVLNLWQFRPAQQNGQPAIVEAPLDHPSRGSVVRSLSHWTKAICLTTVVDAGFKFIVIPELPPILRAPTITSPVIVVLLPPWPDNESD